MEKKSGTQPYWDRLEHAKYFWSRFVAMDDAALLAGIQSLMKGFGTEFIVSFPDYLGRGRLNIIAPNANQRKEWPWSA